MLSKKTPPMNETISMEELIMLGDLTITLLDAEIDRALNPAHQIQVIEFFTDFYYRHRIYSLFIPSTLTALTETVFTNEVVRDVVLNLTDRLSVFLSVSDVDVNHLVSTIVEGVTRAKQSPGLGNYSLINEKIRETIYISPDPLRELLNGNFWLLTLTMVYLFFTKSKHQGTV